MEFLHAAGSAVVNLIEAVYSLLWGDIITLPLPGGGTLGAHPCPGRSLLYCKDAFYALPHVPGDAPGDYGKAKCLR